MLSAHIDDEDEDNNDEKLKYPVIFGYEENQL